VRFVAIKSDEGRELAIENDVDPDDPHTFIFIEKGKGYLLSDAVFALSKRVGGPGRHIRVLRFFPRILRDWVYARLANNRYALFGKLESCYLPESENEDRFVLE
jgi:predicted DCC family thiol-disulfide oxidoreductase YuxK